MHYTYRTDRPPKTHFTCTKYNYEQNPLTAALFRKKSKNASKDANLCTKRKKRRKNILEIANYTYIGRCQIYVIEEFRSIVGQFKLILDYWSF